MLMTLIVFIIGAALAATAGDLGPTGFCNEQPEDTNNTTGTPAIYKPIVPLYYDEDFYVWFVAYKRNCHIDQWVVVRVSKECTAKSQVGVCVWSSSRKHISARTGLVILMMLFTTCICYIAFVALCCGDFGRPGRICGLVGFCIVAAALIIYFVWLGTGTYFLVVLDPSELTRSAYRSYAFYMGFLYAYICVFIIVCIIGCIWRAHDLATKDEKKLRSKGLRA